MQIDASWLVGFSSLAHKHTRTSQKKDQIKEFCMYIHTYIHTQKIPNHRNKSLHKKQICMYTYIHTYIRAHSLKETAKPRSLRAAAA
jgi:hypothetical protein